MGQFEAWGPALHQPCGTTPSCTGPSPAQRDYTIMCRSITSLVGLHHHVQVHHQPSGTTSSCSGPPPARRDYTIMFRSITSPAGLHHHVQVHHQPSGTTPSCTDPLLSSQQRNVLHYHYALVAQCIHPQVSPWASARTKCFCSMYSRNASCWWWGAAGLLKMLICFLFHQLLVLLFQAAHKSVICAFKRNIKMSFHLDMHPAMTVKKKPFNTEQHTPSNTHT